MGRRRGKPKFRKEHLAEWIKANRENGYYRDTVKMRPVELLRPLRGPYVRVRDMETKEKWNMDYRKLTPLSEMEVLALFFTTDD